MATPPTRSHPLQRRFDAATLVVLLAALCAPLAWMTIGATLDVSQMEQRTLAKWPDLPGDARQWARYPRRVERAFTDRMGLRLELTRGQALLETTLFGTSPTPKLVVGRDGWLFFGEDEVVAHARRVRPLPPAALARWADVLEARREWLRRQGAEFLFVLVPDKHLVYPEHLPRGLAPASGTHPVEQLSAELARRGRVAHVDLLAVLEAEKRRAAQAATGDATEAPPLYHKTDTHWNDLGAYRAYVEILAAAGRLVPELADDAPVAVTETHLRSPGLGLAQIVGLGRFMHEDVPVLTPIRPAAAVPATERARYEDRVARQLPLVLGTGDPSMPRAVVFRDSFSNALVPFLSEHFERIVWVWDRDVLPEVVLREQPDLVIQEVVGRFLERRPKGPWELLEADARAGAEAGRGGAAQRAR